eukprot:gene43055-9801_t
MYDNSGGAVGASVGRGSGDIVVGVNVGIAVKEQIKAGFSDIGDIVIMAELMDCEGSSKMESG